MPELHIRIEPAWSDWTCLSWVHKLSSSIHSKELYREYTCMLMWSSYFILLYIKPAFKRLTTSYPGVSIEIIGVTKCTKLHFIENVNTRQGDIIEIKWRWLAIKALQNLTKVQVSCYCWLIHTLQWIIFRNHAPRLVSYVSCIDCFPRLCTYSSRCYIQYIPMN